MSSRATYREKGKPLTGWFARRHRRVELARSHLLLGHLPDALGAYKKAYELAKKLPMDPLALNCEYAYALGLSGVYEPALGILESTRTNNARSPQPYYVAGWIFMFAGYGELSLDMWELARGAEGIFSERADRALDGVKTAGGISFAEMDSEFEREMDYPGKRGLIVLTQFPGPERFKGGLRVGDVIVQVGKDKIEDERDFRKALDRIEPGKKTAMQVWRDGKERQVKVRVESTAKPDGLPAAEGVIPAPSEELFKRYAWAEFLRKEGRDFQALLAYRKLIEEFPAWYSPYIGYARAASQVGAFRAGAAAMRQAIEILERSPVPSLAEELKASLDELEKKSSSKLYSWRQDQSPYSPLHPAARRPEPQGGGYIAFGGGQFAFANGSNAFTFNSRLGKMFASGTDVSGTLSYSEAGGAGTGLLLFQRFPLSHERTATMLNAGFRASFFSKSTNQYGPMLGLSWFFGRTKDRSFDFFYDLSMTSPLMHNVSFGITRFVGQ